MAKLFIHKLGFMVGLVLVSVVLGGAESCEGDVPIGGEDGTPGSPCDPSACGPALGLPTIVCVDGTVGGNTGQCLHLADGTCGWEIRECPEPGECDVADCGPAPESPTFECEDGTLGGNTGRCILDASNLCGWEYRECPKPTCDPTDCGPPLRAPTILCEDGTLGGNTGRCILEGGVCAWEIRECPPSPECSLAECGPMPDSPTFLCADGSIGGNTGRCLLNRAGICGWEWRDCPDLRVCGGIAGLTCPAEYYCHFDEATQCGDGDQQGTCMLIPTECNIANIQPVCGCDGMTYGTGCEAAMEGFSVRHQGPC